MASKGKVLMIYTGGTIGMLRQDMNNPLSPLVPASWKKLKIFVPSLNSLDIDVELHEMELIDSSDMHPGYWIDIAKVIRDEYNEYDGFVVLHGTDTMTYTASALSFLLENLDKPVIITGSQISISEARNDAASNLVPSLMFATPKTFGIPLIPEVCIYFNNKLLRGNRTRKISSSAFGGFDTPNYKGLADIGEHIKVDRGAIREPSEEGFFIYEHLETNVLMFDIFPGLTPERLKTIFDIPELKGVVFRTFGAGNAPTYEAFLNVLEYAVKEKNLAVVNITQCPQGMVEMGLYDASAGLLRKGLISGVDMTPEAALTKMMFLLGQYPGEIETVKEMMQKDLRGEQNVNVYNFVYEAGHADMVYKAPAKQTPSGFNKKNIVSANIRIDGAVIPKDITEAEIKCAIFMNYPQADENTSTDIPQCVGLLTANYHGNSVNMIYECTEKFLQLLNPDRPVQINLVSKTGHEVKWEGLFISIYTSVD